MPQRSQATPPPGRKTVLQQYSSSTPAVLQLYSALLQQYSNSTPSSTPAVLPALLQLYSSSQQYSSSYSSSTPALLQLLLTWWKMSRVSMGLRDDLKVVLQDGDGAGERLWPQPQNRASPA
ncbi:hypothetical protein CRUP_034875 [Coryphaenoides rupestris]|nr:hypothetical protein CRUP_034875 [Coryphaenoides rupestris]